MNLGLLLAGRSSNFLTSGGGGNFLTSPPPRSAPPPPHRSDRPKGFFDRLLRNIGNDIGDIVTGVPRLGLLVGRNIGAGAVALNPITGSMAGLSALGVDVPGGDALKGFIVDTARGDVQTARATADYYRHTYGPLFRGDFGTFGERVAEHPVFVVLDAQFGLPGIVGQGVGVAGKVARVTRP